MNQQVLATGGSFTVDESSIVCRFDAGREVLSTSAYNGGLGVVDGIFNHRLALFVETERDLPGGSAGEYLARAATAAGFRRDRATGLLTNARMSCHGYGCARYRELTVEALATAGVDSNAARAGDPACYYEYGGDYQAVGGTVNILAMVNASLPPGTLAKALITITEAKAALLQELAVVSPLSGNPATGTGTDGVIIAGNSGAALVCTDAGTHAKLGELLCAATRQAVRQALELECEITPRGQGGIEARLARLGLAKTLLTGEEPEAAAKLLLAASHSLLNERRWNLLDETDLRHWHTLLAGQSRFGRRLADALRKKAPPKEVL